MPPPRKPRFTGQRITLRLSRTHVYRIDELAEQRYRKRGARPTRSDILREGLEDLLVAERIV